jgi:Spy/CpxP family protein refolding chaperone
MKNRKIAVIAALFLVVALAGAAAAQPRRGARAGMRDTLADRIGVREYIQGLQLSDAQREDIKAILKAHRTDILNAREALVEARIALLREEPNGPADIGAAQSRLMQLRQTIWSEIKPKLTGDQLTAVQNRLQRRVDALKRALQNTKQPSGN